MHIQEIIEIEHETFDAKPQVVKNAIDLAKGRILRLLEEHVAVSVENKVKDGHAFKKVIVTFNPK